MFKATADQQEHKGSSHICEMNSFRSRLAIINGTMKFVLYQKIPNYNIWPLVHGLKVKRTMITMILMLSSCFLEDVIKHFRKCPFMP